MEKATALGYDALRTGKIASGAGGDKEAALAGGAFDCAFFRIRSVHIRLAQG
jgi:hypothetical protein